MQKELIIALTSFIVIVAVALSANYLQNFNQPAGLTTAVFGVGTPTGTLSITWNSPTADNTSFLQATNFSVSVTIECIAGNCADASGNVTTKIQWCKNAGCTNFVDMNSSSGDLKIVSGAQPNIRYGGFGPVYESGPFGVSWTVVGQNTGTYELRVYSQGNGTTYLTAITYTSGADRTITITPSSPPTLGSISAPAKVKGGSTITIAPVSPGDPESQPLNFFCNEIGSPTSANTKCTQGSTLYSSPYSGMTCSYTTAATDNITYTVYCRTYDGTSYSTQRTTTYTTDLTAPSPVVNNLAGDPEPLYYDQVDDGVTKLYLDPDVTYGDASACRWSNSNVSYASMTNNCTWGGATAPYPLEEKTIYFSLLTAYCDFGNLSEGPYTMYYACKDSVDNYSSTLSINFTVMFPPTVTINNLAGDSSSPYADTVNDSQTILVLNSDDATECTYSTTSGFTYSTGTLCSAPSGGTSNCNLGNLGGGNHIRYYACKNFIGNSPTTDSISFSVNFSPLLTSISDSPDPIKGGSTITVSPVGPGDPESQLLNFFCNETGSPTSANTKCTQGSASYNSPYSTMTCSYATATTNQTYTVYCVTYDGTSSSAQRTTTYTTDSTPPTVTINNLAGDSSSPYADAVNDNKTILALNSVDATECRWSSTPSFTYSAGTVCNSPTIRDCNFGNLFNGSYTRYYACRDGVGNNSSTSTSIIFNVALPNPPTISVNNLEGDTTSPYLDQNLDNNISVLVLNVSADATGCRWSTTNVGYASMTNNCTIAGSTATCTFTQTLYSCTPYTRYYACTNGNNTPTYQIDFNVNKAPYLLDINAYNYEVPTGEATLASYHAFDNTCISTCRDLNLLNPPDYNKLQFNFVGPLEQGWICGDVTVYDNSCLIEAQGIKSVSLYYAWKTQYPGQYTLSVKAMDECNLISQYSKPQKVVVSGPIVSADLSPSPARPNQDINFFTRAESVEGRTISSINKDPIAGCTTKSDNDSGIGSSIATNTRIINCLEPRAYTVTNPKAYDSAGKYGIAAGFDFYVNSCSLSVNTFNVREIASITDTSNSSTTIYSCLAGECAGALKKNKYYRAEIKLENIGNETCKVQDMNWSSSIAGELSKIISSSETPNCLGSPMDPQGAVNWVSEQVNCSFNANNFIKNATYHEFGYNPAVPPYYYWWGFNFKTPSSGTDSIQTTVNAWSQVTGPVYNYYFTSGNIAVGFTGHKPSVLIVSPSDGNNFLYGSVIDFNAIVTDDGNDVVSMQWDSNNDGTFGSTSYEQYNGLSVGDHNITFTATDSLGASGSDSIKISVLRMEADVFAVEDFKVESVPAGRFMVDGNARISATIRNYSTSDANASIVLTISDAFTNQVNYTYTETQQIIGGNYYRFNKDINFALDLNPKGTAKSYYVKLKVLPAVNEENISNNEAMQTILLTGIKAVATPEIRVELIALVLAAVLILLLPKKSGKKSIKNK
ncbi:MAG: hypothetical protein AB1467_00650 [Candidatus Diapherotrites archaeon]